MSLLGCGKRRIDILSPFGIKVGLRRSKTRLFGADGAERGTLLSGVLKAVAHNAEPMFKSTVV